jgi:hypothetical protein
MDKVIELYEEGGMKICPELLPVPEQAKGKAFL